MYIALGTELQGINWNRRSLIGRRPRELLYLKKVRVYVGLSLSCLSSRLYCTGPSCFQTSVDYYATAVEDYLAQLVEILGGSTEAYADILPQVVRYLRQAFELLQPSPLPPPSGSATPVASSPDHTGEDHSDSSPAGSVDQEAVAGEPATPPPQLVAPPPAVVARQRR